MPVNSWRVMWLLAVYDCPVGTREERFRYQRFRTRLLKDNFLQHQFSVYLKHFPTLAAAEAQVERLARVVPKGAHVAFYYLTDKQYGMTREFLGTAPARKKPSAPRQVELF